eukprot:c40141_g1_i1 orf=422-577(-)
MHASDFKSLLDSVYDLVLLHSLYRETLAKVFRECLQASVILLGSFCWLMPR